MGSNEIKRQLISTCSKLSIGHQCELLGLARSSYYYEPQGESIENLRIMTLMDRHAQIEPTAGVLTMQSMLKDNSIKASCERVRRLMKVACIKAVYPRRSLTVRKQVDYVYPYLLRGLAIIRVNQVWQIDITYVPMSKGYLYLTAIIDVYSRYIVGWNVVNTLATEPVLEVVKEAVEKYGKPEILNSDQGCQFTSSLYTNYLKKEGIQISMDGKGRALDNIYIERFWRTIKYDHIYLNPAEDGLQLYEGIKKWLVRYHSRDHQGIERQKPENLFKQAA